MKIGVMSDTHDNLGMVRAALAEFDKAGAEHILHAGDICSPFVFNEFEPYKMRLEAVFGNNDGDWLLLSDKVRDMGRIQKGPITLELGGRRIALMHEPVFLDALAESGRLDLVVYGHLHGREKRKAGGALIVNPGECSGYLTGNPTVMVCDLDKLEAETIELG